MLKQLGKPDAGVEANLKEIYRTGDGRVPDVGRLEVHRTPWARRLVLLLVVLAASVGATLWLGRAVLGRGAVGGGSLGVSVDMPQQLASGEAATYTIRYVNRDRVPLRQVQVTVRYPQGFSYTGAKPEPANEFHTRWDVGDLAPGQDGRILLNGTMIGEVGAVKNFEITTSYTPSNFSSTFSSSAAFSSQITSSILSITLDGPDTALPDQPVTYTLTYQNTSERTLLDVEVQAAYPASFVFSTAQPAPVKATGAGELSRRWRIASLEPTSKGTITITGGFAASAVTPGSRTPAELVAQVGFLDAESEFSLQQEVALTTAVIEPGLSLALVVNGKSTDAPVNLGETVNYSVVYKNIGTQVLGDVTITLTLDSPVLDLASLEDTHLGSVNGNIITWAKDQVAALGRLQPLDEGTIDFTVKLNEAKGLKPDQLTTPITSTLKAVVATVNDRPLNAAVAAKPLVSTINTTLDLDAQVRYFDDDNLAVGSGPLPPVVGQKTTYRVYWRLANSLNEVTDVAVTTTLSPGVTWEGKQYVSAGDLAVDEQTRQVTWTVSRIPPGKTGDDVNVWFDIGLTPTAAQAGRVILLTAETNLTAKDAKTKSQITKFKRGSTTNLDDDPIGGGRGLVETGGSE